MNKTQTFSIAHIAEKLKCKIIAGDPELEISGISSLKEAQKGYISFVGNKKYASQVKDSAASAVLVDREFNLSDAAGKTVVVCENPNMAFAAVINMFAPPSVEYPPGVHPAAVVADSCRLGVNVHIGACAVIAEDVEIGDNTVIGPGCVIGQEVSIGSDSLLYANITIRERCIVGSKVIIHPGTTIGSDGFGFEAGPTGIVKIPQVGIVRIDDDVEIGANCTIDRARFGETRLKSGVKLDNQVHVAHNVEVGEFSMLIGQCGVAGSAHIGRGVIVAAKAGINGHITLGDGARIAGTAGVVKDVPPGATVIGTPAEPQRDFMARMILPKTVNKLKAKISELEKQIKELKSE